MIPGPTNSNSGNKAWN